MTERIENLLKILRSQEYKKNRTHSEINTEKMLEGDGQIRCLKEALAQEKPFAIEGDLFGFYRSTDFAVLKWGNVTPNYKMVIEKGTEKLAEEISKRIDAVCDEKKKSYGKTMLEYIEIIEATAKKYREFAKENGNERLYRALSNIPQKGAQTLYEALVFLKLSIYVLKLYGTQHLTLGRFDQYMYSYYLNDKKAGVSDEEIFELIEAFFITLNFDSDLYIGVQQGDNGQSMVLGGFDKDGKSMYNELSEMCMKASLELCLIDPKINLRVGKNTPDELYKFGTELTKKGLGFPQYCNDDVVVPGLVKLGYEYEDALDYSVAACWEYIIPGHGFDIPNFDVMDFPGVVNYAIMSNLMSCESFEELENCVKEEIKKRVDEIVALKLNEKFFELPILSLYMNGCAENLCDMTKHGTKYMNFGCHGAGIANAADALAAVKKNIYDEKTVSKQELIYALDADFEGFEKIRKLLKDSPKMGNNDDYVDDIAAMLMDTFSKSLNGRDNGHGGIWRAGTGSAMEYLLRGKKCPATADGRKKGDAYSSSFSPSLDVKPSGLLSVIQSFTKYDMTKIINGGPLTIEIHDSVLRNDEGVKKTAQLVKNFILLGGHQLQLNSINRDQLIDAQKHPEKYPNLIVRVWGWSGYFNELDVEYQNHIIRRLEYMM